MERYIFRQNIAGKALKIFLSLSQTDWHLEIIQLGKLKRLGRSCYDRGFAHRR